MRMPIRTLTQCTFNDLVQCCRVLFQCWIPFTCLYTIQHGRVVNSMNIESIMPLYTSICIEIMCSRNNYHYVFIKCHSVYVSSVYSKRSVAKKEYFDRTVDTNSVQFIQWNLEWRAIRNNRSIMSFFCMLCIVLGVWDCFGFPLPVFGYFEEALVATARATLKFIEKAI